MSRPRRPVVGSLSKSLHGRPIAVTAVSPTITIVHQVPSRPEAFRPSVRHKVKLEIGNPGDGDVSAEIHYNNGSVEKLIPAHDSRPVEITCEGDSPRCFVANPNVSVSLIAGTVGGALSVAGGYEQL